MRNVLLILLLLFANWSFGQKTTPSAAHRQIPGTKLSLVPPTNFEASSLFKGFQNPNDLTSMIIVVETPRAFDRYSLGFNKALLATQGMTLMSKTPLKVNDQDAFFIKLEHDTRGITLTKSILIFGNENASTMINGVSLKDSVVLARQISKSVRSAFVDTDLKADPRAKLSFTIDESVGDLQFVAVVGNAIFLNRDKKTHPKSKDKVSLIIDWAFREVEIKDPKSFLKKRLSMLPGNYALLAKAYPRKTTISGKDAYELRAVDSEKDEELHMVILFEEGGSYYIFVGIYQPGAEQAKADINAVMETFLPK